MEIETLKRSHLKRNIIIAVVVVAIISAIILTFTKAKYRSVATTPLIHSTINYSAADLNIVAITVDGEEVDTIPTGNYELSEESYCEINGVRDDSVELSYNMNSNMLTVTPMTTKGTKCYLYFDKELMSADTILAGKDIQTRNDFSTTVTDTTTGVMYQTADWKGTSYYFAGAPTDNWVRFGGFYWRIVRVNGDGSVRLIYNGTSTSTTGTMINNGAGQAFNSSYNRSEYVGLKYTTGQQHGQTTDSSILNILQSWYTSSNLDDYADYIDTSIGFCSDRNMNSGSSWSSQPSSTIYYAAYGRIEQNQNPSLACTSSDIIAEPVGLITADEVAFAGGVYGQSNSSYYLYNNQYYWTMSPYRFYAANSYAIVFAVNSNGALGLNLVNSATPGVRPVINLKADTKFQGSGTVDSPFEVVA